MGEGVTVFPHVFVARGTHVGASTVLYPGVFLGAGARGEDCVLHPNVVVRDGCRVGESSDPSCGGCYR